MNISCAKSHDDGVIITPNGRFDFSCHKEFRSSYSGEMKAGAPVILDMKEVEYMDSSALGMLLVMREFLNGKGHEITIRGCQPDIKRTLQIANFEKLFDIE